ncbi:MAG: hypothetical protein ACI31G_03005 [Bacilli bacterium]
MNFLTIQNTAGIEIPSYDKDYNNLTNLLETKSLDFKEKLVNAKSSNMNASTSDINE